MTVTEVQIDSIRADVRVLSDTVSHILVRVKRHDARFDRVDKHLANIDQRFDDIDEKFVAVDQRFDGIDQKFVAVDQRFDGIDSALREILALVKK